MKNTLKQMFIYKKINTVVIIIAFLLNFSAISIIIPSQSLPELLILEENIAGLGTNSSSYIKFQNDTGIYETSNGVTIEIESFVEPEWKTQYREYIKKQEQEKKNRKLKNNIDHIVETVFSPISCIIGFLNPLVNSDYDFNIVNPSISATTQMKNLIMNSVGEVSNSDTFSSSNISYFDSNIKLTIDRSNSTHVWVIDPTNQTDGYFIELGSGYQELKSSRGQMYRHWYNETTGKYTFSSGQLVNKTGVIDGTDWVTSDEYPTGFVIQLYNGTTETFETPSEISNFISLIDNSTIWTVGYESFSGLLGFYLNFQDLLWGHGQYLWWPRLKNGQLSPLNEPLYAVYPHLYVNSSGVWYDKLLNDRSFFDQPSKNPSNNLHFYNTSDTFGIYYTTYNITIFSSNWDFEQGFKYNFTDRMFHQINHIRCNDRDFDDVGFGYDITSSPQSDGTSYQLDRFKLTNGTHVIEMNISQLWEAEALLENFYSYVEVVSQNNESFSFTFEDMEETGFTQKYLNLHEQQFPNGISKKTLQAGMKGYGSYSDNTWIKIDPTIPKSTVIDNYDLHHRNSGHYGISGDRNRVGTRNDAYPYDYAFLAFDTGLTDKIFTSEDVILNVFVTEEAGGNGMESGEGVNLCVYNVKGD